MKYVRIFDPKTNINFVGYFKISWICTGILIAGSIIGLLTLGMPWGIDFLGGTEMQVKFAKQVSTNDIRNVLEHLGFTKNQVQQLGSATSNEMLIRVENISIIADADIAKLKSILEQKFKNPDNSDIKILFDKKSSSQISLWLAEPAMDNNDPFMKKNLLEQQRKDLAHLIEEKSGLTLRKSMASLSEKADIYGSVTADDPQQGLVRYVIHFEGALGKIQKELANKFGAVEIRKVDFVDSHVSKQLRTDGLLAVIYAILAIVVYIAIRFDMYFSPGAVFSLLNDTLGALIVFIFFRVEFDVPSIAAILTIIGYSINNTVVIYDRIREILPHNPKKPLPYDDIKNYVNKAINETLSRTINSTLTTLFASVAIWIFTSGAIQNFAIVLSVGITVGAFSSAFVAPAAFLLAKKYIKKNEDNISDSSANFSREDKAKGVV